MTQVRFCHIKNVAELFELVKDGKGDFTFKGIFSMFGNSYKELFKFISENVTFFVDQVGDSDEKDEVALEKCVARVDQNLSDTLFMPHSYPDDYENIVQGYMISEQNVNLLSVYYNNMKTKERPLLMMFDSFPPGLWLLVIFTFIIFTLMLYLHVKVRPFRRRIYKKSTLELIESVFFELLFHFLKMQKMDSKSKKIMSITVSLASFFIIFFLTSMVKTDLVVIEEPPIINSYQDMVKYNSSPLFNGLSYLHRLFINPNQEDKIHLMNFFRQYKKDREFYIKFNDFSAYRTNILKVLRRTSTIVIESFVAHLIRENLCGLLGKDPERIKVIFDLNDVPRNVVAHISIDPTTTDMRGAILNLQFTKLHPKIFKLLRIPSESGMIIHIMKDIRGSNSFQEVSSKDMFGPDLPGRGEVIRLCKSESIVKPDVTIISVGTKCIIGLILCCIMFNLFAGFFLVVEMSSY